MECSQVAYYFLHEAEVEISANHDALTAGSGSKHGINLGGTKDVFVKELVYLNFLVGVLVQVLLDNVDQLVEVIDCEGCFLAGG